MLKQFITQRFLFRLDLGKIEQASFYRQKHTFFDNNNTKCISKPIITLLTLLCNVYMWSGNCIYWACLLSLVEVPSMYPLVTSLYLVNTRMYNTYVVPNLRNVH